MIHDRWGHSEDEYEVLGMLLAAYSPRSILDVGCGFGRLFGLFGKHDIQDVVGVDYVMLFASNGFAVWEKGLLGAQTYQLYGRT